MRGTPLRRIASITFCVRNVPCQKSTDGSVIARAMSGFAAKWETWSTPRILEDVVEMRRRAGGKVVVDDELLVWATQQLAGQVAADEARPADDERSGHRYRS